MQNNLSTSNFNYIIKRIISIVVLLTVIVYLFGRYVKIVQYPRDSFYDFYNYIEKDAIDVLCVGSSHVYCGINPVQMYDDYGIAAFDLSVGGQAIWHSFYYISEALKTQNPKVVILDIFTLRVEDDDYFNDNTTQSNLLNMKASYDKWKAIQAANVERGGQKSFLDFQLPIPDISS